jgi:hypothetical protein
MSYLLQSTSAADPDFGLFEGLNVVENWLGFMCVSAKDRKKASGLSLSQRLLNFVP